MKRMGKAVILSLFTAALLLSAAVPQRMDAHAKSMAYNVDGELVDLDKISYDTVHLRYRYGDPYMDRFQEYPYIAWMLDFAADDIRHRQDQQCQGPCGRGDHVQPQSPEKMGF